MNPTDYINVMSVWFSKGRGTYSLGAASAVKQFGWDC